MIPCVERQAGLIEQLVGAAATRLARRVETHAALADPDEQTADARRPACEGHIARLRERHRRSSILRDCARRGAPRATARQGLSAVDSR